MTEVSVMMGRASARMVDQFRNGEDKLEVQTLVEEMTSVDAARERALVGRSRNGDAEAFEELVRLWRRRLLGYLARTCGDSSSAEDLAQETLLRVWRALGSYEERHRFGSWLMSIAHNVALNHQRARWRRPEEGMEPPVDPGSRSDPSLELLGKELGELLRKGVESLPEKQRRVFLLRQHGVMKFHEIAELTGEPLSTVLGHMSYATKKLRRIVEEYGNEGST